MTEKSNKTDKWRTRRHCEAISWSDLGHMPEQESLIDKLLFCGGLSMIYGDSGTGKTFVALWMAACIASAREWMDRKCKQGTVVILATEAGLSIKPRLDAIRVYNDLDDNNLPPVYIVPDTINIGKDGDDVDPVINEIKAISGAVLVIVDTMNRAIGGGDENTPKDMGGFIDNCHRIRTETGAHVMIVHHSGKVAAKGARGHSSLRAAVDTEINVVMSESKVITAKVTKQRDTHTGDAFHMRLEEIEIGRSEDNEPLTSCVLVPSDAPAIDTSRPKLSKQQRKALDVLYDCLADQGETRTVQPDHDPVLCVSVDNFKESLMDTGISEAEDTDNLRRAYDRLIKELGKRGVSKVSEEYIWIPDETDNSGQTK